MNSSSTRSSSPLGPMGSFRADRPSARAGRFARITLEDPAHQSAPKPARASRRADAGTESLPRGRRPLHRKASATSATTPNEVPIKAIGITALIWLMGLFCFVVSNHKSSPSELPPPAAAIPQQVVPMPAPHWRAPDAPDIAPSATTPLHP